MRRSIGRMALMVATFAAVGLATSPDAFADPPEPSDYRSEVVAIEPATDDISVEIIGGDSFIELTAARGVIVDVVGYFGEPYLRFGVDGTVEENQASPTYAANSSRFGSGSSAAENAAPRWVSVADDGTYLWHDHRTHWMSPSRPPDKSAGDVILDGTVEVLVNGTPTLIRIRSTWLPSPSRVPPLLGLALGATIAGVAMSRGSRRRGRIFLVGTCAAIALGVGLAGLVSVPAAAGFPLTSWMLPAVAAAITIALMARWPKYSAWTQLAALSLAATPLVVWGWLQRHALSRALIPTVAPGWLDRFLVAFVAAAAVITLISAMRGIWSAATPPPSRGDGRAMTADESEVGGGGPSRS